MARSIEEETLKKIDQIWRLLGVIATRGLTQREQISILNRAGFEPKEIAELLGTTGNTVNVALFNIRKAKQKKRPGPRSKKE